MVRHGGAHPGLRDLNHVVTDPPLPDLLFAEPCVSGAAWFTALTARHEIHSPRAPMSIFVAI
jgi:hypothetical protein